MRITNKIMQNNNLANINTNKISQDRLSNQMSTLKKIGRPSEDPVVAIRALRLRSNVTEVTQYYTKNIPDAESWMNVTEDALINLSDVLEKMIGHCTKGANGELTSSDRQNILEQLKALADEVYYTGDADYAGRYVFTGYRTDTSLRFPEATVQRYTITEQLDRFAIDELTYIDTHKLKDLNSVNYNTPAMDTTEFHVQSHKVHRIRLAYDKLDNLSTWTPAELNELLQVSTGVVGANGKIITAPLDIGGGVNPTITIRSRDDSTFNPYTQITTNLNDIYLIPETGEMLLGENVYNALMQLSDDVTTPWNEAEIQIKYEKSEWDKGDLRPEHYFYCVTDEGVPGVSIEYNFTYLTGTTEKQSIEYDVGFNQTIKVNSTADECFKHGVGREVDEIIQALELVEKLYIAKNEMKKIIEDPTSNDSNVAAAQTKLEAIEKSLTLQNDKLQRMFEGAITYLQDQMDFSNLSITNIGARASKLELVERRMQTQKTTFETLKSNNEDVDVTEVIVQLTSAEFTYQAALLAIGKIAQTSLLNYL